MLQTYDAGFQIGTGFIAGFPMNCGTEDVDHPVPKPKKKPAKKAPAKKAPAKKAPAKKAPAKKKK